MFGIITDSNRFAHLALAGAFMMFVVGAFAGAFPIDQQRFGYVSTAMTVALALPAAYSVVRSLGKRRGVALLLALSAYAFAIELVGTRTGFPYGAFTYHGTTWRLFGLVPWTTPFGWVPLVIGAYALVRPFVGRAWLRTLLATVVLVGFDLVLDPGAVALGIWSYADPGRYYGIPLTNFLGWMLTGGIVLALMRNAQVAGRGALVSACLMMAFWTGVAASGGRIFLVGIGAVLVWAIGRGLRLNEKAPMVGR